MSVSIITQLKGASPYNASSINKLATNLFELRYFGVGVNFGGMRGNSDMMLDFASQIEKAGLQELKYWINIKAQNTIGKEMSRCKSGAIAPREICKAWQNGVDHVLTDVEIDDAMVKAQNMIDDVTTIKTVI